MGQVPELDKHLYGIVGGGRVAKHFTNYFSFLNIPFIQWKRTDDISVEERLSDCTVIILLITDRAIELFVNQHPVMKEKILIHFSGSLIVAGVQSFHPLMSFSNSIYDLETYKKIPFIYESGQRKFTEIFPQLPNPSFALDSHNKQLYHALCVLAGNFTTILWQKMFSDFESKFGIKRETIFPYMNRVFKNLEENSQEALTGPLVRNDIQTINDNLMALDGDPFKVVYQAFVDAYKLEKKK